VAIACTRFRVPLALQPTASGTPFPAHADVARFQPRPAGPAEFSAIDSVVDGQLLARHGMRTPLARALMALSFPHGAHCALVGGWVSDHEIVGLLYGLAPAHWLLPAVEAAERVSSEPWREDQELAKLRDLGGHAARIAAPHPAGDPHPEAAWMADVNDSFPERDGTEYWAVLLGELRHTVTADRARPHLEGALLFMLQEALHGRGHTPDDDALDALWAATQRA
jgi:hypothetical protein